MHDERSLMELERTSLGGTPSGVSSSNKKTRNSSGVRGERASQVISERPARASRIRVAITRLSNVLPPAP